MITDYYIPGWQIKRPVVTNSGGIAKSVFSTSSTVSGLMRPLNGDEILQNERKGYKTTHRFYCAADVDIKNNDNIFKDGRTYDVKYIANPMEMNHHLQIDCEVLS